MKNLNINNGILINFGNLNGKLEFTKLEFNKLESSNIDYTNYELQGNNFKKIVQINE
jgi:hypothetical protein